MAQPSYALYTGDGVQLDWSIPFDYIDASHVKVLVDGVDTAFTFPSSGTARVSPAAANGAAVYVYRETDADALVAFANNNNLTAENLNLADDQSLKVAQEARDIAGQSMAPSARRTEFDAKDKRIVNVVDPVDDQDAATKKHVADYVGSNALGLGVGGGQWNFENKQATNLSDPIQPLDAANKQWVESFIGTSADDANAAKIAAEAARDATLASQAATEQALDNFDDVFLGRFTADPVLDNDGNALQVGALYYNTAVNELRGYNGSSWAAVNNASLSVSTDGSMAADSDALVPSQKAVNTRINDVLSGQPCFQANTNGVAQTGIPTNTFTKVSFTNEEFDTGSFYDAPNSKWVPPAGVVEVFAAVRWGTAGLVDQATHSIQIRKNGTAFKQINRTLSGTASQSSTIKCLVPVNGLDYIEVYVLCDAAGDQSLSGSTVNTYWSGKQVVRT